MHHFIVNSRFTTERYAITFSVQSLRKQKTTVLKHKIEYIINNFEAYKANLVPVLMN